MNYNYYNYYYIVNNFNHKPYMAKNMLHENMYNKNLKSINNLSVEQEPTQVPVQAPAPAPTFQTGYLAVQVLSKTGQPIKDALVTVFHFHDNGELHVHYNVLTDENGNVPLMELFVKYVMPGLIDEPTFTTYNIRAFAKDYYPVNIINFRIYPNVETDYTFELTPLGTIESGTVPEQTIVYPNTPSVQ